MRDVEDDGEGGFIVTQPAPPPRVTPRWLAWLERFSR